MTIRRHIKIIPEVDSDSEISKRGINRWVAVETLRGDEYRHGRTFAHKVDDRYLLYSEFPIGKPSKFPYKLIPANAPGLVNPRLLEKAVELASKIPFAQVEVKK